MNCLQPQPASTSKPAIINYANLYARPGAIHDAFSGQFAAFAQDAIDNQRLVAQGKLTLPVLAIGGDHSYGAHLATEIGFAASNVRSAVINNSGHWIMEEQPQQAISIIVPFLEGKT
jgi:pimeloyl-ACP methyl ester carboxylesterase